MEGRHDARPARYFRPGEIPIPTPAAAEWKVTVSDGPVIATAIHDGHALRPSLQVGHECPVCTQTVTALPEVATDGPTVETLTAAWRTAQAAQQQRRRTQPDSHLTSLTRRLRSRSTPSC